jgi:hypothetical protein
VSCGQKGHRAKGMAHSVKGEQVFLRIQVSVIEKSQITNHKYQANNNDRNSKSQTIGN